MSIRTANKDEMEELKYSVSIKRGYKIFYMICFTVCLISAICIGSFGLPICKTAGNYIVICFLVCFFFSGAISSIYVVKKKVIVYKGKIVYSTFFKKVEYKPSEVYSSNTKIVQTDYRDEMGGWTSTEDKVTTFYNRDGKKLFAFGLAYENVQRLEKTVANNRKSIENMRR